MWAALAGIILSMAACGQLPPLPAQIDADAYVLISYEDLLAPKAANLQEGQKIKVAAYFWQYLTYDPDMARDYLNHLRYPLSWYKMDWFATYGSPDMQGYFDRATLEPSVVREYKPRRLDHLMMYGELAALGPGLYLRVHRLERMEED